MRLNVPIALASLVVSVMLWFVVYAQNLPVPSPVTAPIALDGLDDSRYFVRKAPTDLRIVVSGPSDRIQAMREERVTASVDLSQPKVGIADYPVALSPTWVARFLVDTRPVVRIQIEPMASRLMDVSPVLKGSLRDSTLQVIGKRITPTRVTVRGPQSEVDAIREVRAYLDLAEVDPLRPDYQQAELVPLDANETRPAHVRVSPGVAGYSVSVGPSPSTKLAQVVPDLNVNYDPSVLPDGYRIEPENVTISGKPSVLANISKVPTQTIRAEGLKGTQTFRVRLIAPTDTVLVGPSTVNVTVRVRPAPAPRSAPRDSTSEPPAGTPTPVAPNP